MAITIAVIGLGHMGGAMAHNLVAKGFDVHGYDLDSDARDRFKACGGTAADSVEAAIQDTAIVLSSLPNAGALQSIASTLAEHSIPDRILIELSTFALEDKKHARDLLRTVGCITLDCPVSGTASHAASGDLTVFGSGEVHAFERAKPVLQAIARSVLYIGEFGNGSALKYIANHLVTIHNVATAEALTLAKKAGLNTQLVYDALKDSAATSKMFQVRGSMVVNSTYSPAMRISTYQKDLDIIGSFAVELRCPTPLFDICSQLYLSALSLGYGDLDTAAVAKVHEMLAGMGEGHLE